MSLGDSIRHGAKWLLTGNLANQILQFGFGVVLARLLVPADFGLLVTVQIFTGLAGFIAAGGTGQALVRAREAKLEDFQVVFTIQLAVGLVIYAAFFATAPLFAGWYHQPLYVDLFRVSALSFILRPFVNVPHVWLTREMRFKQRTLISLICVTLGSIISVLLAWQDYGVWSLVFGGIANSVLNIVVLTYATPIRPALRFDGALAKELGIYGFKVTTNDLVGYVRSQAPNFFLGRLQGPAVVGLFNKADSLARNPRIVAHAVYDPVFRSLASIQDNLDRSRYIYLRTITLLAVYMLPLFIGISWLAHPFVAFFYGAKWMASAAPLAILSLLGPFACIGYPSGAVLAAQNWLGREFFVQVTQAVLYGAAAVVGIRWGLAGVAWGILLAEGICVTLMAYLATRCLGSTFGQLARSFVPGVFLNSVLLATLLVVDALLPEGYSVMRPFTYMAITAVSGGLMYVGAFLFLPIPALASEALRWKTQLQLQFSERRQVGR